MRAILVTLIIGAFGIRAVPHAAAASSTTQTFHMSGIHGGIGLQTISGCLETDTSVYTAQSLSRGTSGGPPPPPGVAVEIFQGNDCTQTILMEAIGFAAPTTLQMSRTLSSGAVTATVPMTDTVSDTSFSVSVNLSWAGTGPVSRSVSTSHYQSQGFSVTEHTSGSSRPASAVGSITDGTTEWAPSGSADAQLFSITDGYVQTTNP